MHQGISSATFSYVQLFNTPGEEEQLHLQDLLGTLSVLVYSNKVKLFALQ